MNISTQNHVKNDQILKEEYADLEISVVMFEADDVIVTSGGDDGEWDTD